MTAQRCACRPTDKGGDNKPQSCRWMSFPSALLVLSALNCLSAAEVKRAACHTGGSFLEDDAPLRRADQGAEDPSRTLGRQEAGGGGCRRPLGLAVGNFRSWTHKFFFLSLSSVRAGNRGVKSGVDGDVERGWLWRRDLKWSFLAPPWPCVPYCAGCLLLSKAKDGVGGKSSPSGQYDIRCLRVDSTMARRQSAET
ncbi:hypothetical protein B0T11DRAFT_270119 [Plectosphaerella cucumerina]|uniref:Uncharacterized protein n=1 Tax=Plectosphaerella cucumerina TaxID=40658 RepID=A0A8K0TT00_9PEZI|nr:hypothetical protein B0T11DRAFT_270119 [Plectosphaerella cucumerina]